MLGQIRKRVQDRRQQSPCNSPQTTPTAELPPTFAFVRNQGCSFETDESMDLCEMYKTPTQKAVPIEGFDVHTSDERSMEKERKDGKDLKSRRPSARRLKLQLPKSGNKLVKQQSTQQREENTRYFLRSNSVVMNEIN